MILQSLCDYYQRKNEQQPGSLAPPGFEPKGIPFIILLTPDGTFAGLEDTRSQQGKKQVARTFLVPKAPPRSGAKAYTVVNPLWDHYGYLLAQPKLDKPDLPPTEKAITLAQNQHQTFSDFLADLQQQLPDEPGLKAIVRFNADARQRQAVTEHASWPDALKINGCNLSFRLVGESDLICQSKQLQDFFGQQALNAGDDSPEAICLVTGETAPIARLHSGISGVNAKPAPFAASNLAAFDSFGKSQGFNFPVSNSAVFEYSTALNHLLRQDSPNKFRLGETVTVCWAEKQDQLETTLPLLFS
ncbi:MAG: type I-C CRISPR-associated protein Cas8c/Csd1, partial [Porticoccaceae bacterium]|nr:type I-C CRISPR-associated protein Cas8c/Csd1 [Porticoccaceae bacterium]